MRDRPGLALRWAQALALARPAPAAQPSVFPICEHMFVSGEVTRHTDSAGATIAAAGERIVVCVLLARFHLSVAAARAGLDRESLIGNPVALAPAPGGPQVVGEVGAAAEAFTVTPGLPVAEAYARCPQLKLLPPDPAAARAEWEGVVRALEGVGAEVESDPDAPGTAFFEAAGLRRLHGGPGAAGRAAGLDAVIAAVRAAVPRPLRIGVGRTRFVALAAARTTRPRKARIVLGDRERREFLARAPVDWLAQHAAAPAARPGLSQGAGRSRAGTATAQGAGRSRAGTAPAQGAGRSRAGTASVQGAGRSAGEVSADKSSADKSSADKSSADKQMTELVATLSKLGIETLGEFALLRRAQVAERFGAAGLAARDIVHGREPPLRPRRPVEALVERIELIDDADGQAGVGYDDPGTAAAPSVAHAGAAAPDLQHALALLVERLVARPERADRTLRGFTLVARFAEGGSWSTRAVMREPTADPARIKLVLLPKLLELPEPAASLELLVDAFGPFDHAAVTLLGEDPERERAARLRHAAEQARLAAGDPRKVARVMRLETASRLPERRASLSPGPAPLARPRPIALRTDEDGRPLLLPPAAQHDRRQRRSRARRVPAAPTVPVAHERERWVVEDRWWTGRPLRRRYFELVLADGRDVVVFQDLASGRWFEQRA